MSIGSIIGKITQKLIYLKLVLEYKNVGTIFIFIY